MIFMNYENFANSLINNNTDFLRQHISQHHNRNIAGLMHKFRCSFLDAEEATSEAFANSYINLLRGKIKEPKTFVHYVYIVSERKLINKLNKERSTILIGDLTDNNDSNEWNTITRDDDTPLTKIETKEEESELERIIRQVDQFVDHSVKTGDLPEDYTALYSVLREQPSIRSKEGGKKLGISAMNFRLKKHRLYSFIKDNFVLSSEKDLIAQSKQHLKVKGKEIKKPKSPNRIPQSLHETMDMLTVLQENRIEYTENNYQKELERLEHYIKVYINEIHLPQFKSIG